MPYQGGRRDRAQLRYDPMVYTPEGAKLLSDRELKKEYSRLRSIARKRLERFEGTEWTDTQIYLLNTATDSKTGETKPKYKPISEIESNRELRHALSEVSRYVDAQISSVRDLENQRTHNVKTLNERGYKFVNKKNYRQFGEFMEYSRIARGNKLYDSKRVAEFFEAMEKRKMSNSQLRASFLAWTLEQAAQQEQEKIQHKDPKSSARYRKDLYK